MIKDKIFLIQGVRFPGRSSSFSSPDFNGEGDFGDIIRPDIFRSFYFGIIKMENRITFTGVLKDYSSESNITGAWFADGLVFFNEQLHWDDRSVYNLKESRKIGFFSGTYQWPSIGSGFTRCYLQEVSDSFFDVAPLKKIFSINGKELLDLQWLNASGIKCLEY